MNPAVCGYIKIYAQRCSAPLDTHLAADRLIRSLGAVELFNKYGRYLNLRRISKERIDADAADIFNEPRGNIAEHMMIERIGSVLLAQKILGQSRKPALNEVAVGRIVRAGYHFKSQVGFAEIGEHPKQHVHAEYARVDMVIAPFDYLKKAFERLGLFAGIEHIVIYRHRLRGLAGAYRSHSAEVYQIPSDRVSYLIIELFAELAFERKSELRENIGGFLENTHACHAVRKFERRFDPRHRTPVSEPNRYKPALVAAARDILAIAEYRRRVLFDYFSVAAQDVAEIRNIRQRSVPRGTVAPFEAPAARRHYAGQRTVRTLSGADIAKPLAVAVDCIKIHQYVLGGESGVTRPAVFLAVRAVCREIIEIRKIGVSRHRLKFVRHPVGATE